MESITATSTSSQHLRRTNYHQDTSDNSEQKTEDGVTALVKESLHRQQVNLKLET